MGRNANKEGSTRKLPDGSWECVIQSKYLNPKTGKPKRFKRKAKSADEAVKIAKMNMRAWEKEFERGRDTKVAKSKTFGSYMEEFIDNELKPTLTGSGYKSYISCMRNNFYEYPIANYQLHMLNAKEFETYYDEISSKKSKKTCILARQLCVRCLDHLIIKSLIDENYAKQVFFKEEVVDEYDNKREKRERERKKIFTNEDIEKFYYAYKNNLNQYAVVALFLLETGLRAGEFSALKLDNVDLENNKIYIREATSVRHIDNDKDKGLERYYKVPKNKELTI